MTRTLKSALKGYIQKVEFLELQHTLQRTTFIPLKPGSLTSKLFQERNFLQALVLSNRRLQIPYEQNMLIILCRKNFERPSSLKKWPRFLLCPAQQKSDCKAMDYRFKTDFTKLN